MSGLFIAGAILEFVGFCFCVTNDKLPSTKRLSAALTVLFLVALLVVGAICL